MTLWALISQVSDPDKSLSNAAKLIIIWIAATGEGAPSSDTGVYSKARQRFNERVLRRLVPDTADALEHTVPDAQQWCFRRVRVFDRTTVPMSDTAASQKAYLQRSNQKPGCGFPLLKLVVVFSLWTGAVVKACVSCFKTSELENSRLLYQQLNPGDVALADQAYGTPHLPLAFELKRGANY